MDFSRKNSTFPNRRNLDGRKTFRSFFIRFRKYIFFAFAVLILFLSIQYIWKEKRFRYIVIHHTASDIGNLAYYRRLHMKERGWPDIAYHFLVNNGSYNTAMGQIEQSNLWDNKSINYSTKVSYVNYFGIAVAIVGNFERHSVPALQWESIVNLTTMLSQEYGIPPERIIAHRELWETACPGKNFDIVKLRSEVRKNLESVSQ